MNTPLITAVVPVYNSERFLSRCISSLINQTYTHIEIIIINDGSTDKCEEIIYEFAATDKRIISVFTDNRGAGEARNYGINIAKGKYITFVDSDDYLPEDAIYNFYQSIKETDADICLGSIVQHDINNLISLHPSPENRWQWFNHTPWGKLFSKKFLMEKNIRFIHDIRAYEDVLFGTKALLCAESTVFLNTVVYYYEITDGSVTNKNDRIVFECLKVRKHLKNLIRSHDKYNEIFKDKLADLLCLQYYKKIDKKYKKELFNKLRQEFTPQDYKIVWKYGSKEEKCFVAALKAGVPGVFNIISQLNNIYKSRINS